MKVKTKKIDGKNVAYNMADGSMVIYQADGDKTFLTSLGQRIPERCRHQRAHMEAAVDRFNLANVDANATQRKEWLAKNFKSPIPQWVEWTVAISCGIAFGAFVALNI